MPHTAKTALLNPQSWDLQLTKEGNILLTSGALAIAQNLANEIRLWTNDAYFQQANGIASVSYTHLTLPTNSRV